MAVCLAIGMVIQTACQSTSKPEPISGNRFLLNTFITITLYDPAQQALLDECFERIETYEQRLSRTVESSEIARLNARKIDTVSADTARLLEKALSFSNLSGGRFDITIEPIAALWNFSSSSPIRPDSEAIKAALLSVGYEHLSIDGQTVTFDRDDTRLDLGAIAKGFIADEIKAFLLDNGVEHGIIDLGGNILCIGDKPDGTPYTVGIQDPDKSRGELLLTLSVSDCSVVTSGIYERCFEQDGKTYHHILDPDTGYPCDNELASVTILSEHSVDGDGYSTACMAMGLEKSRALINQTDGIDAVWVTKNGDIYYSEGLEERYTLSY